MSMNLRSHAFSGNPLRSKPLRPTDPLASETREVVILPFNRGRPLVFTTGGDDATTPIWHLSWLSFDVCKTVLEFCAYNLSDEMLVYLGAKVDENLEYKAVEICENNNMKFVIEGRSSCFVQLSALMVAADWSDQRAMDELAIAGRARALFRWHDVSQFCGSCGKRNVPKEAGNRVECSIETCKKQAYPRVDPVVAVLVIDRENDQALLIRKARYVERMWSCLDGFVEAGESLEDAVRRETWRKTGIEVGEVVYHSSQPWPVLSRSRPCQLMLGCFAYAKTFEINVDKDWLEDAQWHSREDVKIALEFAEYEKAQVTAATKLEKICKGVGRNKDIASDFNLDSGVLAPMFIPGPFAIAHHLISTWVDQCSDNVHAIQQSSVSDL